MKTYIRIGKCFYSMCRITSNYQQVIKRINQAVERAGLSDSPQLLAVSKKHSVDKINALAKLGHQDFGENYVQEAVDKIDQCRELGLVWHFIGPIQSNKTKLIAANFAWVHSVDRLKIIKRLQQHLEGSGKTLNVLLQLKVGDEASKSGASLAELLEMAEVVAVAGNLKLRGLMCIPPPSKDFIEQKTFFMQAKHAYDELRQRYEQVDTLSMGMSGDMEAAIECGSTLVRVGTDLFGQRL